MPVIETKLTGRRWLNGIMLQGQKDETSGITVKSGSLLCLWRRNRNAETGFFHINNGLVERYHDLALVEILEQDRTLISINRAQPANLPLTIHELERHPLGTQAFIPMKGEVFVVVVALGDDKPDLSTLRAFITNGEQGVNYHRNVWHHPLFALAARHRFSDHRSRRQ